MVPAGEEGTEWDKTNLASRWEHDVTVSAWQKWAIQDRDWQHSQQQLSPAARLASSSECSSAKSAFLRVRRDLNGPGNHSVWGDHHTLWQPRASVMFCMHLNLFRNYQVLLKDNGVMYPLNWVHFLVHPAPQWLESAAGSSIVHWDPY